MPTLATTVDGLKLPNPFIIGSGPPGTNLNVIRKRPSRKAGARSSPRPSASTRRKWSTSRRVTANCIASDGKEVIGWENIELISDRPFKIWEEEFKKCKDMFPDRVLIASIMEEYRKDRMD